jgi:hypothetical protein
LASDTSANALINQLPAPQTAEGLIALPLRASPARSGFSFERYPGTSKSRARSVVLRTSANLQRRRLAEFASAVGSLQSKRRKFA